LRTTYAIEYRSEPVLTTAMMPVFDYAADRLDGRR
jgi:hypothetical protein